MVKKGYSEMMPVAETEPNYYHSKPSKTMDTKDNNVIIEGNEFKVSKAPIG
jgi:hypothetical protein